MSTVKFNSGQDGQVKPKRIANNRLIVALDVDTKEKALSLVVKLKKDVRIFKIGSELFTSCGPGIVEEVKNNGCDVFLDLKFHDIPNTVAKSAAAAAKLGVFMFNVHAIGGAEMMKKAAEAAREAAKKLGTGKPNVIAVTVLTSMDENNLKKIGIDDSMETQVLRLAKLAKYSGLDGIVASPSEIKPVRNEVGEDFLIVTPGVRPLWAAANDQKRVATPKEAIDSGASFIVIGRPIIESPDPINVVRKILGEI